MSKNNGLQPIYTATLPNGWRWARLSEVCLTNPGTHDPRRSPESTFKYVDISGVDNARKRIVGARTICGKDAPSRARQVIRSGDVIVATTRPNLNAVALIPTELDGEICSTGFCVLRPREALSSDFLFAFTQSQEFVKALSELVKGALYPAVTDSQVRAQLIPLPPLSEQKRIAVILGEQMAAVEQARAAAAARLKASLKLSLAVMAEAFQPNNTQGWRNAPLGEVGQISAGVTLGRNVRGASTRAVPYLRVANVKDGHLDLSSLYTVEATEAEIGKCRLQYGDLLLTEGGDPDKLGRGTFWEEQVHECIHQNHIFRVRFDLKRFSPAFLSALVGSPYGKAYFLAHAKQTTGIATINQKVLANFPLLLPSFEEQERVAAHLRSQLSAALETQAAVQAQLDGIERMPAALLFQAFSGQLSQRQSFRTRKATVAAPAFDMRGAVSSYIVNRLHNQPSFGNILHQKLLFLVETHVGFDLGGVYYRDTFGPHEGLDFYRLNGRGQWAEKRDAFHLRKRQGLRGYTYTVGANMEEQIAIAEAALGERKVALDALLDLFAPMTTDQAEMYATLFAVWNDFLITSRTPTDAEIIQEFRENWHERKQKFTPDQLRDALTFMRANQLVPHGVGLATRIKN